MPQPDLPRLKDEPTYDELVAQVTALTERLRDPNALLESIKPGDLIKLLEKNWEIPGTETIGRGSIARDRLKPWTVADVDEILPDSSITPAMVGHMKGASALRSTNAAITTGTLTNIGLPDAEYDPDGLHDPVTNSDRVQMPDIGWYIVAGYLRWAGPAAPTGYRYMDIILSGGGLIAWDRRMAVTTASTQTEMSCCGLAAIGAADYARMRGFHTQGVNLNVETAQLALVRIAPL